MNVGELKKLLRKYPNDMPVAYELYSEYSTLEEGDIKVVEACMPRADRWVARKRPDKPVQKYLMLPGN